MSLLVKVRNVSLSAVASLIAGREIRIIDISKWQSTADNSKLFNFDVYQTSDSQHLIVKASQGVYADTRYSYHISNIIPRKIFFGTYHFGDTRYSAVSSARVWAAQINALPEDDYKSAKEITRHWLDVENYGFRNSTRDQGRIWIRTFLAEVERLCPGVKIGIYTSYYGWRDNVSWMPEVANRDLWIAHYGTTNPSIPNEWYYAGKTWLIHQTCDNCTTCGACGKPYGAASISIDFNRFNGDQEAFNAWHLTGEEHMPTQEYLELKAMIEVLQEQLDTHTHDGGTPPPVEKYTAEYIVTASDGLRMRDAPENGAILVVMPYNATILVDPNVKIADDNRLGYWVPCKYGEYEGWTADWYLKKK